MSEQEMDGDTMAEWGDTIDTGKLAEMFREYADRLENHESSLTGISQTRRVNIGEFDTERVEFEYVPEYEGDNWTPKQ